MNKRKFPLLLFVQPHKEHEITYLLHSKMCGRICQQSVRHSLIDCAIMVASSLLLGRQFSFCQEYYFSLGISCFIWAVNLFCFISRCVLWLALCVLWLALQDHYKSVHTGEILRLQKNIFHLKTFFSHQIWFFFKVTKEDISFKNHFVTSNLIF